ncbi:MAG: arylesterase [Desulfobacterales bacterium RIFOXYA12_FULL_46_15]|nr:MAG: arylesterase [Desulfobacterales bacterium RIFOXYA12_FULL_46_15]
MKRFFLICASFLFLLFTPLFSAEAPVRIVFLGDSLTAGLGVEPQEAYPSVIQEMLNEKQISHIILTNGSISGSTSASAASRLKWFLRAKPDILVLALGANDGLRGLSMDEMYKNLDNAIVLARQNHIRVILAGMEIPPNYGPDYSNAFREVFKSLARKYDLEFIPFLLEGVAGNPSLNQADGIHPNAKGHRVIAAHILPFILEK